MVGPMTTSRQRERHRLVLEAVSFDEAFTVMEIAQRAYGFDSWDERTNVRNALADLETAGLVISDENRPVRYMRPDPTMRGTQ